MSSNAISKDRSQHPNIALRSFAWKEHLKGKIGDVLNANMKVRKNSLHNFVPAHEQESFAQDKLAKMQCILCLTLDGLRFIERSLFLIHSTSA